MRIIVNSDILYTGKLTKLPHHLQQFAEECGKTGAIIVLPRTTVLEVEKRQRDLMNKSMAEVESAYETLQDAGVQFERREVTELFDLPDIVELFRSCGATVEVEEPTLEDFIDAHRRACLHLSPQAAETKSDEMRDLVIWAMALRIAKSDKGATLLSRDEVHTHNRGDTEALAAGLVRVKSVDDMQEIMGVESPGGQLARSLLEPIWNDLRSAGLPLSATVDLRKIDNRVFTMGEASIEQAGFDFKANAESGGVLAAHIEIATKNHTITEALLQEITLDGAPWRDGTLKVLPNKPAPKDVLNVNQLLDNEQLDALREVLGG